MAHYEEFYPSRFLKGVTLSAPKTIRIVELVGEVLEDDDGRKKKAILKYKDRDGEGEIVWCKTNAILTSKVLGIDDPYQWPGHLITIWHDPTVPFGKDKVGGIRVYGGPNLTQELRVGIKRPRRKKEEIYILKPTGKPQTQQQPATPPLSAQD